jgi:DNA (cytosine-5)-methyltransferase 1
MNLKLKAISLFSSAGIGELYFNQIGINVIAANEILEKRANCYTHLYPDTKMICGDIRDDKTKNNIKSLINDSVDLLIATPPCQGLSTLGKNKSQQHFELDHRNYLIFDTLDIIDFGNFNYIIIENVPRFLKMYFPFKGGLLTLEEILIDKYSSEYEIDIGVYNAKDYGVPQTRPRAIIKMYKKGLTWENPSIEKEIPLRESIGHLPSIEPGRNTDIKHHNAKPISDRIQLALKHTKEGCSAHKNKIHFPKKANGEKIKGFHNTYKRMKWDQPSHARTTYSGSVSSHNNVHPGRLQADGTYSDARVLTILETLIVSSIPEDIVFPKWVSDTFIREIIGESIPPLMLKGFISQIAKIHDTYN